MFTAQDPVDSVWYLGAVWLQIERWDRVDWKSPCS